MFSEEHGLPVERNMELSADLIPEATHVSRTPCCTSYLELEEII